MSGSPHAVPAVITPDAVGLDLDVATLGSRGAAYLIDAAVLVSGLTIIGIAQAFLGGGGFVDGWFGIAVLFLLGMLLLFGYPIGFETMNRGRTPGKMALGLRVVTVEGAPIGVRHAAIRAMAALLELLGSVGAIAILTSFASSRSQRLGDLAAGTLVVRERRGSRAGPQAAVFRVPAGLESYVASVDVRALGAADYAAIRETLQRVDHLPPAISEELTRGLAARLLPRIQPPPPAGVGAPVVLQALAAAIQARRQPVGTPAPTAGTAQPPAPERGAGAGDRGTVTAAAGTPQPPQAEQQPTADQPPQADQSRQAGPPARTEAPSRSTGFAPPD